MAVNTFLLDFTINSSSIINPAEKIVLQKTLEFALSSYVPGLKLQYQCELDGGFAMFLVGEDGCFATVRAFKQGVLTVNIEYYRNQDSKPVITFELIRKLKCHLGNRLNSSRDHAYPPFKRGDAIERYFPSSDERILEYDIDKVLFEEKSPYQKIQIVHSKSLGNLLVLDELQNMSESDLVYTETLMQRGKEDYKDKEIVILGGGDGALLWELIKEKPKFVTMIEIDEMVMKSCSVHLRSCCGDCLDKRKGDNYEIIVDDCVKILKKLIEEGKKFDYVFGDLTDIPLSPTPQGEMWDFIRMILNLSFQVLKPDGKYMTHGNGASCPESLRMFEEQFKNLDIPIEYSIAHAFIPSFMEDWVFYQAKQKSIK